MSHSYSVLWDPYLGCGGVPGDTSMIPSRANSETSTARLGLVAWKVLSVCFMQKILSICFVVEKFCLSVLCV